MVNVSFPPQAQIVRLTLMIVQVTHVIMESAKTASTAMTVYANLVLQVKFSKIENIKFQMKKKEFLQKMLMLV